MLLINVWYAFAFPPTQANEDLAILGLTPAIQQHSEHLRKHNIV